MQPLPRRGIAAAALALIAVLAGPGATAQTTDQAGLPYFVVIHSPGPAWRQDLDFRSQPGISDHIAYWSALANGPLVMGGPFLDGSGGMMIVRVADIAQAQLLAEVDPTVKRGLLIAKVKPWLLALRGAGAR